MKHDVGVAVAGKAAAVRHFDAAEHDRALAGEGVDVEAHAGARRQAAREPLFRPLEIGRQGELLERGIAFDGRDFHPSRPKHRGFVGREGPDQRS